MQNKVTANIPVNSCFDCPYFNTDYGIGGGFDFCDAPKQRYGISNIDIVIKNSDIVQEWCPYKVESENE